MKEGGEDRAAYRRAPGEGDKERGIALFPETLSFFLSSFSEITLASVRYLLLIGAAFGLIHFMFSSFLFILLASFVYPLLCSFHIIIFLIGLHLDPPPSPPTPFSFRCNETPFRSPSPSELL
jgi:hypothetical protein